MAAIKTQKTDASALDFIQNIVDTEQKKQDSYTLLKLFQEFTGYEPKMWGASIIGFGAYHYKSERSRQEGDWPLVGFSPRKAAISLYVFSGGAEQENLVKELGKIKMGKGCIYVKKLADINIPVLQMLIKSTIDILQKRYGNE